MKNRSLIAAAAALLILPVALLAADKSKKTNAFTTADTDGDGRISAAEYVAAMKGKLDETAARTRFAELDKDRNGSLSREEFDTRTTEKKTTRKAKNGGSEASATESQRMPRQ